MAIIGIGCDLCDARRILKTLKRFGLRFEQRVFTPNEMARVAGFGLKQKAAFYAKRFAAKEACSKALGTGLRGINWRDVELANEPSGKPIVRLANRALSRALAITPHGQDYNIHLTITDEDPLALAMVVIEAIPKA